MLTYNFTNRRLWNWFLFQQLISSSLSCLLQASWTDGFGWILCLRPPIAAPELPGPFCGPVRWKAIHARSLAAGSNRNFIQNSCVCNQTYHSSYDAAGWCLELHERRALGPCLRHQPWQVTSFSALLRMESKPRRSLGFEAFDKFPLLLKLRATRCQWWGENLDLRRQTKERQNTSKYVINQTKSSSILLISAVFHVTNKMDVVQNHMAFTAFAAWALADTAGFESLRFFKSCILTSMA